MVQTILSLPVDETPPRAADFARIIAALSRRDLGAIADRLAHLQKALEEEPDEQPMEIESLRQFVRFLMTERRLPRPRIAISPDGLVQIEWRCEDDGIVAMKFLPNENIQFVGIHGRAQDDIESKIVSGALQKDDTLRALQSFMSRIASQ